MMKHVIVFVLLYVPTPVIGFRCWAPIGFGLVSFFDYGSDYYAGSLIWRPDVTNCNPCGKCISCGPGMTCPGDANAYWCPNCPSGQYRYQTSSSWNGCPRVEDCTLCAGCDGLLIAACTATTNTDCLPFGYYRNGTTNVPCRSACEPGTFETVPCGIKDRVCTSCIMGMYSVNQTCRLCEPGFYCMNNSKIACPTESTSFSNATSYMDCYCKPGTSGMVISRNETKCTQCAIGSFCPGVNAKTACNC